ncbi:hypothetical protein COV49_03295 [Candidatus Falkowbacteria bacterium CG11_big_fil_rev_8_21_14_0_20_39_10]|uniref:Uncharacterized protein n=1 Tax=Candidatus Falkowbacteria bacterium CG11_big_fil_rev_8_21_14_0_20_39_10 TaxID=1974570 RepID=A0A2M6K8H3_9BACT|nr:MAG: hypothetical protein COV49_03295 [Candidatus Falkowbacteria bacterium CG11_big_fil_rev_8_21_14_0_20_39_10]
MILNQEAQFELTAEDIEDSLEGDPGIEAGPQPEVLYPDEYVSGGSQDNLKAIKEKYGEGNWEKSWDSSQDVETKYNRTENYMELAGPEGGQNLTEQIGGSQYEAQHLEILDGWKNNPTETQFVEHKEIVDGQEVLHVTAITLGPDDVIHSETWTRKLEEHEKNFDGDGAEDDLFGENPDSGEESDAEDDLSDEQKNSKETFALASAENKKNQNESSDENFENGIELFQENQGQKTEVIEIPSGITMETTENNSEQRLAAENDLQSEIKLESFDNFEIEKIESSPAQNPETEIPENEASPGITLEIIKPAEEQLIEKEKNHIGVEISGPIKIFQPETDAPAEKKSEITNEIIEKNNTETKTLKEKSEIIEFDLTAETGIILTEISNNIQTEEKKPAQPIEIRIIKSPNKETELLETKNEQTSNENFDNPFDSGITIKMEKTLNISREKEIAKPVENNPDKKENQQNLDQEISSEAGITLDKKETSWPTETNPILVKAEIKQPAEKENIKETDSPKESAEIIAPKTERKNKESLIFNDAGITLKNETVGPKTETERKNTPESNNPEIQKVPEKVISLFDRLSASPKANLGDEEDIINIAEEGKVSLNNFGISLVKQAS